jgi:hypothetical protein
MRKPRHLSSSALDDHTCLPPPHPPTPQLEESSIIDKLEMLCDAARPEGEWLRQMDLVEAGGALELRDMGKVGGGLVVGGWGWGWGVITAVCPHRST